MQLDIFPGYVPPLLGLDMLDAEFLCADNVTDPIVHRRVTSKPGKALSFQGLSSMALKRFDGDLYAKMDLLQARSTL